MSEEGEELVVGWLSRSLSGSLLGGGNKAKVPLVEGNRNLSAASAAAPAGGGISELLASNDDDMEEGPVLSLPPQPSLLSSS